MSCTFTTLSAVFTKFSMLLFSLFLCVLVFTEYLFNFDANILFLHFVVSYHTYDIIPTRCAFRESVERVLARAADFEVCLCVLCSRLFGYILMYVLTHPIRDGFSGHRLPTPKEGTEACTFRERFVARHGRGEVEPPMALLHRLGWCASHCSESR